MPESLWQAVKARQRQTRAPATSMADRQLAINGARFRRDTAEQAIIEGVRRDLATPAAADEVLRRVRVVSTDARMPSSTKPASRQERIEARPSQ